MGSETYTCVGAKRAACARADVSPGLAALLAACGMEQSSVYVQKLSFTASHATLDVEHAVATIAGPHIRCIVFPLVAIATRDRPLALPLVDTSLSDLFWLLRSGLPPAPEDVERTVYVWPAGAPVPTLPVRVQTMLGVVGDGGVWAQTNQRTAEDGAQIRVAQKMPAARTGFRV